MSDETMRDNDLTKIPSKHNPDADRERCPSSSYPTVCVHIALLSLVIIYIIYYVC